jgi:putative flippase GtrA
MSKIKKASELPDLHKQLIKFTLIGVFAVLVDLVFYYTFLNTLPQKATVLVNNEDISKTLSFVCGALVTYNLNKFWTWKQRNKSNTRFAKFFSLYLLSLIINVGVNKGSLIALTSFQVLEPIPYKYFFAFIAATGFSAVFNFAGQKLWVFSEKKK